MKTVPPNVELLTLAEALATYMPHFVPLTQNLTGTEFNGETYDDTDNGIIDLSVTFGAPAGIKAIYVNMLISCPTVGKRVSLGPSSSYPSAMHALAQVSKAWVSQAGIVPCDSNGDVYFSTDAVAGSGARVYIRIWGYWI